MSYYDKIKECHGECKSKMTTSQWRKFAIERIIKRCPICKKYPIYKNEKSQEK